MTDEFNPGEWTADIEEEAELQRDMGSDEPLTVVDRSPFYGGEGHGSTNARQLVVIQPLADRSAMSFRERVVILDSDVREAMALAAHRLHAEAMKYSEQGFEWNLDDIEWGMGGRRIITATLRIARP